MAKNRDRRKDPKPKPPKGEPPPIRKARPDLLIQVGKKLQALDWARTTSPEALAKELREHVQDVQDCLDALALRGGAVKRENGLRTCFAAAPLAAPPKPKKREKLDPSTVLKMRRVFEKVGIASAADFAGVHDVDKYLEQLRESGLITWSGAVPTAGATKSASYRLVDRSAVWKPASGAPRPARGNGRCPWCNCPARRHARAEVHDPEQCRMTMIALIMKD